MEGRLIKEYKPRYNVSFRDDKRFLMLAANPQDPFPAFRLCRIRRDDGQGTSLNQGLQRLRGIFEHL